MNSNTNHLAMGTAALSSAASVVLTVTFTYGLVQSKPMAIVMGCVGFCLELGKMMFAREAGKRSGWLSMGFYALASLMMFISVLASFSALERGFDESMKGSVRYSELTEQIDNNNKMIASYIKKDMMKNGAIPLQKENRRLMDERESLSPESPILDHADTISLIASLALELVCVVSVSLSSLRTTGRSPEQVRTTSNDSERGTPAKPVLAVVEQTEPEQTKLVFQAKTKVEDQIRNAVLTRSIERPSVGCIRQTFSGIASEKISAILKELGEVGHLEPYGRGWKYA